MIHPILISIDTSIYGEAADDYYCNDRRRSESAKKFVEFVVDKGLVPFFSYHHIQEILQHDNDTVVFNRWSLIRKFPTVSWFCSHANKTFIGSAFDIHVAEVKYLTGESMQGVKEIIRNVKNDLIMYSSGEDFVNQFEPVCRELRNHGYIDIQQSKSIESISHVRDKRIDKIKLSDLESLVLKSPIEVEKSLSSHKKHIEELLVEKGDIKLTNHASISEQFVDYVKDKGNLFYNSDGLSLLEKIVKNSGVELSQINSKTTIGDLGYLAIYNSKMKLIAKSLGCDIGAFSGLSQDSIPSWVIWREIDKMMKNETKANGSNMVDKHIAILACYVDILIIDKRVREYFRQLERKAPILSGCFNDVVKLPHYSELKSYV